jgi:hypothetical protein
MRGRLFWLNNEAWAAIEPHLPKNQPGARRADDRRVISGILDVLKTGCRWKGCPAEYGPSTTIYNRFNRSQEQGTGAIIPGAIMPDNAFIESFNGKFRAECLNTHWFMSLDDARVKMEAWRRDYNEIRPHSAIGHETPIELMKRSGGSPPA